MVAIDGNIKFLKIPNTVYNDNDKFICHQRKLLECQLILQEGISPAFL